MTAENQTPLFSHGIEFLYPRSEDGPSLYALLEGAWMFAALVQGIRQQVWNCDPTLPNPIASAWARQGLITVVPAQLAEGGGEPAYCKLTDAGQNVLRCAGLLEYEFSMMQQQLDGNHQTDPNRYAALRKGLGNYSKAFLPDMHDWVQRQVAFDGANFFDFCGGSGDYLLEFLRKWPCANGLLFDRDPFVPVGLATLDPYCRMGAKGGDAFGDDQFFANHAGAYDVVLMSEILHCKGAAERAVLLQRAKSLLRPGTGVILVIEQYPNLRLEWRMHDMTEGGHCISEERVAIEAAEQGLLAVSGIKSLSHYGIRLEQEQ